MILAIFCLALAASALAQRPFTGSARLRVSDTERYFYNALDHKIEPGWSDDRSIGVDIAYGVVLVPAQNLAQLNFTATNAVWRVETRDRGYPAKEEDQIIFRIRADTDTPLVFFGGPAEDNEPIRHRFVATPQWHLVHVPLTNFLKNNPIELRAVGLRSEAVGRSTVYLGYMYLRVNPVTPPKKITKS